MTVKIRWPHNTVSSICWSNLVKVCEVTRYIQYYFIQPTINLLSCVQNGFAGNWHSHQQVPQNWHQEVQLKTCTPISGIFWRAMWRLKSSSRNLRSKETLVWLTMRTAMMMMLLRIVKDFKIPVKYFIFWLSLSFVYNKN